MSLQGTGGIGVSKAYQMDHRAACDKKVSDNRTLNTLSLIK